MLYYFEKQKLLENNPTPQILAFIKALREWTPEKGSPIGYIMLTFDKHFGTDFANKVKELKTIHVREHALSLKEQLREAPFPSEAEIGQEDFSEE